MSKSIFIILLCWIFIFHLAPCQPSSADDAPPNWPWRGFVLTSNAASSPEDIVTLKKAFSINALRLTFKPRHYSHEKKIPTGEVWDKVVEWLNRMLDTCRDNDITAIVSFSQILYAYGIDQWNPEFWDDIRYQQIKLATITKLVRVCASRGPELGAYEFFTEPIVIRDTKKMRPDSWPSFMKDIVATVRRYDKNRYICITPGPGALPTGYKDFRPLDDEHIIYTAHMYYPYKFTYQGIHKSLEPLSYPGMMAGNDINYDALANFFQPLIEFQRTYGKRYVWISEFSAARWAQGSDQYLKDSTDIFEHNRWSWTYFSFNGYHAWNPFYNTSYSPDDRSIFSKQYVGIQSERWRTLQDIFNKINATNSPDKNSEKPD